jgi:glycosyltransferase involved in cell wall biosynthesis
VTHLGFVDSPVIPALMRRARGMIFPSLFEGFGQPPLEAMACGCPVACSDAASLPEVCGDAARYFHPDDPRQIATAVLDVSSDPDGWSERGLARAAEFTWDASAKGHEDAYRELLARPFRP